MARRRKWLKRALIGFGAVFGLLAVWCTWYLFGPVDNGIPLGPETTGLTGPLDAAGYVDYGAVLRGDEAIPPEQNAAVAVFRVLQAEVQEQLSPAEYQDVCADLNVDPTPNPSIRLPDTWEIETVHPDINEDLMLRLRAAPWPSESHPRVAKWIRTGDAAVALLRDGIEKPRWWFFPRQRQPLSQYIAPLSEESRRIARFLSLRAMNHIGDGHFEAAAADVDLMRTVAERVADSESIIELLIAMGIAFVAADAERELLYANDSPKFLRNRLRVIEAYDADYFRRRAIRQIDRFERFDQLEQVQLADRHRRRIPGPLPLIRPVRAPALVQRLAMRRLDPAGVSRLVNQYADRAIAAMKESATAQAPPIFEGIEPVDWTIMFDANVIYRRMTASHFASVVGNPRIAVHRVRTRKSILRVLAAGRLFELETGRPPTSKEDLVPKFLLRWPVDHFDGEPLREKIDDGVWTVHGLAEKGFVEATDDYFPIGFSLRTP